MSQFFLYHEIIERLISRELISESQSVIKKTEADIHLVSRSLLLQVNKQFVVVIAYRGFFSPDRSPSLIEAVCLATCHFESVVKRIWWLFIHFLHLVTEFENRGLHCAPEFESE